MMNVTSILEKAARCAAAVTAFTIAKPGADDDHFIVSTAVSDSLIGIFQHATMAAEEQIRVMLKGVSSLKLGGTVARGDYLTSDASGQGVAAAPAAGVNNNVIGKALASGVAGDIIPALIAQSRIQG